MHQTTLRLALAFFLPVAACLTVATALVYGAVQQVYRSSANDPQLQIAVDDAQQLDAGAAPAGITSGPAVNLARSLAVHVSVYDRAGRVLGSTARLHGSIPAPPVGALDAARRSGRNIVTWQPDSGVRVAAVIVPWRGGTVLVGRSLGPVEDRETNLEELMAAGWLGGCAFLAVAALLAARLWPTSPIPDRARKSSVA
jgi:hypothetical protein